MNIRAIMCLCRKCSENVSLKDIILNTPRARSHLCLPGMVCDDCGKVVE